MPGGSETNTTTKTWASGRKLSEAERARKREVDRRTKAATRQREKQRVTELESKLAELTQKHIDQQSHVSVLLQAIEDLKKENERYKHEINDLRNTENEYAQSNDGLVNVEHSTPLSNTGVLETQELLNVPGSNTTAASSNQPNLKEPASEGKSTQVFNNSSYGVTINPTDLSIPNLSEENGSLIAQRLISSAKKVNNISLSSICLDDSENQDSLIRLGLTGSIGKSVDCAAWERMIETFEQCFQYCGTVERFVLLRMVHQMIVFQIARRSGHILALPDWYKPIPVQMRVPHEEIADYFAWPSFRERLVFSLSAIERDDFWISFASNFQFCGPYNTLENILSLGADGKYSFVPGFENDMRNIKYWRLRPEFFEQFPELYEFMVPLESIPKQVSNKDLAEWRWPASGSEEERKMARNEKGQKVKGMELSRPPKSPQILQMHYVLTSNPTLKR